MQLKLNDCVYELYAPEVGMPEVDIIFFHGLFKEAYWKTWYPSEGIPTSDKEAYWKAWFSDRLWPKTLLGEKHFRNARILSVSYNSVIEKSRERSVDCDLHVIAENLVEAVIALSSVGSRPVVLVGHSFGGLVIKSFVQAASEMKDYLPESARAKRDRIDNFLSSLYGVFFYATPHLGSRIFEVLSGLPRISASVVSFPDPLEYWGILNEHSKRLTDVFKVWRQQHRVKTVGVGESLPTNLHDLVSGIISCLVVQGVSTF